MVDEEEILPLSPEEEQLASEISRVLLEESPRLAPTVQRRQLNELRALAMQKRSRRRFPFASIFSTAPRWAQVAAIAVIAVLLANGISLASASSLPGSPLYAFKRAAEQSELLVSPTAAERARVWMNLADTRIHEMESLVSNGQGVDAATLDAIDQSILSALSEIAGTHGEERVALLKAITELAIREQNALDGFALKASPEDRVRLDRTARLLNGVASIASEGETNSVEPGETSTATPTLTLSPTETPKPTKSPMPSPTEKPAPTLKSSATEDAPPTLKVEPTEKSPGVEPSAVAPKAPTEKQPEPTEPLKTETEPRRTETSAPEKTSSPETYSPEPTESRPSPEP